MEDLKLYLLNSFALLVSFTDIDMFLKFLLLILSIGYTIDKWRKLRNKNGGEPS